jgi:hypothetical protein
MPVASHIAPKPSGDMQSELMNLLKDPNLRKRLKKSTPNPQFDAPKEEVSKVKMSPEAQKEFDEKQKAVKLENQKQKDQENRQNLLIELLGFMETPNGSIDDLLDKANKATGYTRTFIFNMVRSSWVKAYRLKNEIDPSKILRKVKHQPLKIYRGMEVTNAIELEDKTQYEMDGIKKLDYISTSHMYRFDQSIQEHVLDEIFLFKDKKFPPPFTAYNRPEPPQDNSLENRNRWEVWHRKRMEHQQSDSAQYDLIYNKLLTYDITLTSVFEQMHKTISQIRDMNDAVAETFKDIAVKDLQAIVDSIPEQIKNVAKDIHTKNGIIIKDSDLKLTPSFLKSLSTNNMIEINEETVKGNQNEEAKKELEAEIAKQVKERVTKNNQENFVSFGGLPMETVLPLLQSLNSRRNAVDDKASRRFTLW